jgi:tRNA dimethylallyltransferase
VVGPTATGKSSLGLVLSEAVGGEIISCDSTAVYRGIDIGTDKLPADQRRGIPHHLIDVADPTETFTAARYAASASAAIRDIAARGRVPIVVGGTGFYFQALGRSATTACAAGSIGSRRRGVSSDCTGGCLAWIPSRRPASCRAIRSASCGRSRCIW